MKPMDIIQKRMFFLIVLLFIAFVYLFDLQYGINKTVGWAWDISNWVFWTNNIQWLLFLLGYGLLALIKAITNKVYSIAHLSVIVLTIVLLKVGHVEPRVVWLLNLISIAIFLLNFVWALKHRNYNKNQ